MKRIPMAQITRYLEAWRSGDDAAGNQVMEWLYEEIKTLARFHRRQGAAHRKPLLTTELAHEAYLRLAARQPDMPWRHRGEFFALLGKVMARLLIDETRKSLAKKRAGDLVQIPLIEAELPDHSHAPSLDMLRLLDRLEQRSTRWADIWRCHHLLGLGQAEIAEALELSQATISRELRLARAWLFFQVSGKEQT